MPAPKVVVPHYAIAAAAFGYLAVSWCSPALQAQMRPVEQAEAVRAEVLGDTTPAKRDEMMPDEDESDPSADRTPLGVDFKMLRVIAHQDDTDSEPGVGERRIEIDAAVPAPAGLESILEPYLDQPVSMAALAELARDVVNAWRDSDYPLVDVYYPEQNITDGKVQMVVREALLGEIQTEGEGFTRPGYMEGQMRTRPGDRINRQRVESDLDWLNEHPMRLVNLIYDRGEVDGTSDLILQAQEEKPWIVYAGLANTGTALTGENEFSTGFQWWNPGGLEHGIGYNFTADIDFDSLQAHTGFYQALLPWRHHLQIVGAYVDTRVDSLGDTFLPIGVRGESFQISGDYRIPFGRVRSWGNLRQSVGLGIQYMLSNSDLLFEQISVFDSDVAVVQARANYEANWQDRFGRTQMRMEATYSPGNLVTNNDTESVQQVRDRATPDYFYATGELDRFIRLPSDFSLRVRTLGQWSPDRLTSTEQMLAGGFLSVRGFDEYLVRGDSGVVLNVELLTPPLALIQRIAPGVEDQLQLLAFYDSAWLTNTNADPDFETGSQIQGAGLGLRYRIGRNAQARLAYGWNVGDQGVMGDPGKGRLHFGITLSY